MKARKKSIGDAGITLVALVVTIIVLLVLAGVTVSMILNNNGIISQAKLAGEEYSKAAADEQSKLDSASEYIKGINGGTEAITATTVKIVGSDKAIPITAENAKDYYGYKVKNYNKEKDPGGVYRIFYYDAEVKDGKGKYGHANTLYLKRDWSANDAIKLSEKISNSSWNQTQKDNAVIMMRKMNPEYSNSVERNTDTFESYANLVNDNEKAAAWLCDKSQFSKYVVDTMANFAIGSPSAEMYCDSYNQTHTSGVAGTNALTASYQSTYVPGYGFRVNGEIQNDGWCTNDDTIDLSGYNGMYLCNQTAKGLYFWWLASPSAEHGGRGFVVDGSDAILDTNSVGASNGICPIVSLNSGVELQIVNE